MASNPAIPTIAVLLERLTDYVASLDEGPDGMRLLDELETAFREAVVSSGGTEGVKAMDDPIPTIAAKDEVTISRVELGDLLYRAGEWESIAALLSDRSEVGLYAKVEAALREAAEPSLCDHGLCECGHTADCHGYGLEDSLDRGCDHCSCEKYQGEAAEPSRAGWQDISTAPKGTWLDGPNDTRHPDYMEPPRLWLILQTGQRCVGYADAYYAEGGSGFDGGSYWVEEFSGERVYPTHWMSQDWPPAPSSDAS